MYGVVYHCIVLEFWNHYGPERIRDYIHTTVMTGGECILLS